VLVQITLTPTEAATLREALDSYLSDLRAEIRETDNRDFREHLKQREAFVKKLMKRLEDAGAPSQQA
jgi:hypothetical protein